MITPALCLLAKAGGGDAPGSDLALSMAWLLSIAAVAIAAFVPFRLAAAGGRRRSEGFVALVILWAVIASAVAIRTSTARAKWEQEYQLRLTSGYYDPADPQNEPPPRPWGMIAAAGAAYLFLLVLASRSKAPASEGAGGTFQ